MAGTVLIVEDDDLLADNMRLYLERQGWEALVSGSVEKALEVVEAARPDVIITDYMLPGKNGLDLVKETIAQDPTAKVIMVTGEGGVQVAVDAMKAGAYDYVTKPVVLAELKLLLEKAVGVSRMENALSFYRNSQARDSGLDNLVGASVALNTVKDTVRQILDAESKMSAGDLPAILVTGETGTGKELVARALHFDGLRRDGPFVEINCASIPSNLLETELFGHERGAFTDAKDRKPGLVEAAEGGTLFLDEIGEVDPAIQAKLLKLLEEKTVRRIGSVRERKVNIRIISATNQDLEQLVRNGRFRSDLYFRLRIISISLPPLRERGEDVLLLARHFLQVHGRRYGKKDLMLTPEAERLLLSYPWHGNVRELKNVLEQTVLLARDRLIHPEQIAIPVGQRFEAQPAPIQHYAQPQFAPQSNFGQPQFGQPGYGQPQPQEPGAMFPRYGMKLSDVERDLVMKTLEKTDWNVSKAAKLLGLTRDMLRTRIERYGLVRPEQ
jgi:DNA-binding NtrC family response regulator